MTAPAVTTRRVLIRALGLPVLLPSLLYALGEGAMLPVVAITAGNLGASVSIASLVVASLGVGTVLADIPAGRLAGRFGERPTMIGATAVTIAVLVLFLLVPGVPTLSLAMFVIGMAQAVWSLSRQTYITEVTPPAMRARALSLLGGTHRIGLLVGPFLGAAVISATTTRAAFVLHLILCVLTLGVLVFSPDPDAGERTNARLNRPRFSTPALARRHFDVLSRLGVGILILGAMRATRNSLLPLWAEHVGLPAEKVSLLVGVLTALELCCFYPAGMLMDRKGRVFVAVPCFALMALSHLLLPLGHSFLTLLAVIIPLGFGNGLGTGINMTLGADVSPDDARPEFLGLWRLSGDVGQSGGPVLVSAVNSIASLGPAAILVGLAGLGGAAGMARWIPRWIPARFTART